VEADVDLRPTRPADLHVHHQGSNGQAGPARPTTCPTDRRWSLHSKQTVCRTPTTQPSSGSPSTRPRAARSSAIRCWSCSPRPG
jgi:hypothetical protein